MKPIKLMAAVFLVLLCLICSEAYVGCYDLDKGEKLTYAVRFLYIIPVGDATMEVKDVAGNEDNANYLITCEAKTAKWISLLFKAQALLNSYVTGENLYPVKFEQILKVAGKPDDIRRATYDRTANIMEAQGKGAKKVPPDVRDSISSIYYLRAQDLKEGAEIKQTVNNNQSNYIFNSKVTGKKKIGKLDCWVLAAKIRRENKSMYHSMDVTLYLTDDAKKTPLRIKAMTKVGPLSLTLKSR